MSGVNKTAKMQQRRRNALKRLQNQLDSGVKTTKDGQVPLTDKNVKRIEKEIKTLIERLKL